MTPFFIGSINTAGPWFHATGEGVTACALDEATGGISRVAVFSEIQNAIWMEKAGGRIFVATERFLDGGEVSVYSMKQENPDRKGGDEKPARQDIQLHPLPYGRGSLGFQKTPGGALCHLAVSPDGKMLYAVSYLGGVSVHAICASGELAPAHQIVTYKGCGENKERQEKSHPHQATVSPDGKSLFVCDLGSDKIWVHPIDQGNPDRQGGDEKIDQGNPDRQEGDEKTRKCWLLTFRTYGTWLPGDERTYVDRVWNKPGTERIPAMPNLKAYAETVLKTDSIHITHAQRRVVRDTVKEVCTHRGWKLLACNVRSNHVHVVLWTENPEKAMNDFKSYATRRLKEAGLPVGEKTWVRHGSTRHLHTQESRAGAVNYVLERQGDDAVAKASWEDAKLAALIVEQAEQEVGGSVAYPLPDGRGSLGSPQAIIMPPGSGPRHLVFHPRLPRFYLLGELDAKVRVFEGHGSDWREVSVCDTLASGVSGAGSGIRLHPSGKALFVANRGSDTVTVFSLSTSGELTKTACFSVQGKTPRDIVVSPSGHWLLCVNQDSHAVVPFELDPATGIPTGRSGPAFACGSPFCVLF